MDQTVLLTQNIDLFEVKKKAGAVFVDLIAANDTVWYRGLSSPTYLGVELDRSLTFRHHSEALR